MTATPRIQANFSFGDVPGGSYINWVKGATSFTFGGTDTPASLSVDGLPNVTLTGSYGGIIPIPASFTGNNEQWVLKWPATLSIRFLIGAQTVSLVSSTFSFTNASGGLTVGGAGGRAVFKFVNYIGSNVTAGFPSGAFYSAGTGEICLCRLSDEAAYDAGEYFIPEFIDLFDGLHLRTIRPMQATFGAGAVSNNVQWRYRATPSTFAWRGGCFAPGIWAGGISGTNTYTMGAAPDSPADWTDGEVIQGHVTNANTVTTPTLQVASRSAKTIVNMEATNIAIGAIAANSNPIFVYDGLLGKVIYVGPSLNSGTPIEARVQLANRLGVNLWVNLPHLSDDDYVSQTATYVFNNLDSNLNFYPEYANEPWNFTFDSTDWMFVRGTALGFPAGNDRGEYGYYGLRVRQIMGIITPIWASQSARLKRVANVQTGNQSNQNRFLLKGQDLNTSLYPTYASWVGVNYDASPNRPGDWIDIIAYAPYFNGVAMNGSTGGVAYQAGLSAAKKAVLQTMADTWAGGDHAGALVLLDSDLRTGGSLGAIDTCLSGLETAVYQAWESVIAADWNSKTVECYEGGPQAFAPTTAQCTAMGVTVGGSAAAASSALTSNLDTYKRSQYQYDIVTDYYNGFFSHTHSAAGAHLAVVGVSQWSLLDGTDIISSSRYQTYDAIADFNFVSTRRVHLIATT